jgi:hypothetical protein
MTLVHDNIERMADNYVTFEGSYKVTEYCEYGLLGDQIHR